MWIWAKAHQGQKCSATPAVLQIPAPGGNLLLQDKWPPRATHGFRPWPQTQPLCSHTVFYPFPPDAGAQGDFRGFLQQQKTEGLSADLCDCCKCDSSFSRTSLFFLFFASQGSEGSNQQERAAGFPHPLHPITHLQAVWFGAQDLMSPCFVSPKSPSQQRCQGLPWAHTA